MFGFITESQCHSQNLMWGLGGVILGSILQWILIKTTKI